MQPYQRGLSELEWPLGDCRHADLEQYTFPGDSEWNWIALHYFVVKTQNDSASWLNELHSSYWFKYLSKFAPFLTNFFLNTTIPWSVPQLSVAYTQVCTIVCHLSNLNTATVRYFFSYLVNYLENINPQRQTSGASTVLSSWKMALNLNPNCPEASHYITQGLTGCLYKECELENALPVNREMFFLILWEKKSEVTSSLFLKISILLWEHQDQL